MDDTLALSLVTFFAGRPQEEALGRAVTQQLLKELPGIAVQVQKSQITFRGRYGFAALSLPRRAQDKAAHAVLLTLGLPVRLDSPPGGGGHRALPRPVDPPHPPGQPPGAGRRTPGLGPRRL